MRLTNSGIRSSGDLDEMVMDMSELYDWLYMDEGKDNLKIVQLFDDDGLLDEYRTFLNHIYRYGNKSGVKRLVDLRSGKI